MANILDILQGLLELTLDAKEACPKLLLLHPPFALRSRIAG